MRNDVKSNYTIAQATVPDAHAAGTLNSASVDHADGGGVSFFIAVGTVGASGTIDMKTQHSPDDTAWTDYPAADPAGNDDAITQITATGVAQLNVPNPRARYTRVVTVVAVATSDLGVTSVLGPLRHVAAV